MGFLWAAHGWGGPFWTRLPKIRHTYPEVIKLGAVIPYPTLPYLLTSAFFQRKSANFSTSRNAHIDWNLIDNF